MQTNYGDPVTGATHIVLQTPSANDGQTCIGCQMPIPFHQPVCPAGMGLPVHRPRVVCLIGSTRFYDAFREANYQESLAGRIVLSIGFYPKDDQPHCENNGVTPEQKVELDKLHLWKVRIADEVLVVSDEQGYFGDSTRRELAFAVQLGKPIRWSCEAARERWNALAYG